MFSVFSSLALSTIEWPVLLLLPPHADTPAPSIAAAAVTTAILRKRCIFSFVPRLPMAICGRSGSMCKDLGKEIAGTIRPRLSEELVRAVIFDDPAIGHEGNPAGRVAREAHLVCDHDHRHALADQADHDVQHLLDHLRVKGR